MAIDLEKGKRIVQPTFMCLFDLRETITSDGGSSALHF